MRDREAMLQALTCARSVEGRTSPRPPVGAVIVRDGEIVSTGATAPPYGPHAEVQALTQAGVAAEGAELYVTLEPCCIHVHTPPCTKAICAAGVRRVVIATLDPNPRVYAQGIEQLRNAGLQVSLLEDDKQAREAAELVKPFATFITKRRPHVTAKWAMTLDGKLASSTGDAYWISGPDARTWVHDLRDRVDAIVIGAGTARIDNPRLTVRILPEQCLYPRIPRGKPPLRVVLATHGQLPAHLHLLQPELAANTCVIVGETCPSEQRELLAASSVEVVSVAVAVDGHIDLGAALQVLAQRGIMHVLLEGGSTLLGSAFDQGYIDHVAAFVAPKLIGGRGAPSPLGGAGVSLMACARWLSNANVVTFGDDVLIEGDVVYDKGTAFDTHPA
ncbi:MAG: bifunctional diaminohydroxyphosphoribosylaminopyrimidine deaminase/5-amino-6-(5-phosphoribosylamino)uracil reductase RibD [Ktedonobacteraceae bacterium]|nr:bifunctional diaminohydroxyphosphoribosylaminopyrimidine deaminase/5-amino-6-(5-phosphoribosylamino)uracil reductase RibD [Ktedonobacteraceae bacterium]